MADPNYWPSPLVPVQRIETADGWCLVFTRDLSHPIAKVWAVLTSRDQLREWAPYVPDRDLTSEGPATVGMLDADGSVAQSMPGTVRAIDPPRLLEHAFGNDVLRWELSPIAEGTRLVLRHTFADGTLSSALAAGWHICLDVADALLAGAPFGPVVAEKAREYGWDELNEQYAKVLGVPPANIQ
ncbi:MAG TPA: SRPBCC family protein [Pseudonocardia sp.]|jgi:uncharacterized protein YndB with AHSA1/START domain|uniref:SRPBCC family protein n=1 Tax=Pseudonocardia sp. TaxID=60912 RepID=UPI002EDAD4C5